MINSDYKDHSDISRKEKLCHNIRDKMSIPSAVVGEGESSHI